MTQEQYLKIFMEKISKLKEVFMKEIEKSEEFLTCAFFINDLTTNTGNEQLMVIWFLMNDGSRYDFIPDLTIKEYMYGETMKQQQTDMSCILDMTEKDMGIIAEASLTKVGRHAWNNRLDSNMYFGKVSEDIKESLLESFTKMVQAVSKGELLLHVKKPTFKVTHVI